MAPVKRSEGKLVSAYSVFKQTKANGIVKKKKKQLGSKHSNKKNLRSLVEEERESDCVLVHHIEGRRDTKNMIEVEDEGKKEDGVEFCPEVSSLARTSSLKLAAQASHSGSQQKNYKLHSKKTNLNKKIDGESSLEFQDGDGIEAHSMKRSKVKKRKEIFSSEKKLHKSAKLKKEINTKKNLTSEGAQSLFPGANKVKADSGHEGLSMLFWMLHPVSCSKFFREYWEKKPLHVERDVRDYYSSIFSTVAFDQILHEQNVWFTKNLDVTSYTDGQRETHNPDGRALPAVVWDYYKNGCSLRLLNPQTFHKPVWKLLSSLQEFFCSFCGANVYLTPPDTQGFAPHWDDIEAFVLQLEGRKRWRVYNPRTPEEYLPRVSSENLEQDAVGEPVLDVTLTPGDLLYFPRGFIHQAHAVRDEHSLHITVSTYQKTTWADLLGKVLPKALEHAAARDVEFRKGLPLFHLTMAGAVVSASENIYPHDSRKKITGKIVDLVRKMINEEAVDAGMDLMAKEFMHSCLPPCLSDKEIERSVYGRGERWCEGSNSVVNQFTLELDTPVKLIKKNCVRVIIEDTANLYYTTDNSREYQGEEPQFLELDNDHIPAILSLITSYPNFIAINDLPLADEEDKLLVANSLWERGLLVINSK